jgi:hypothetical protein
MTEYRLNGLHTKEDIAKMKKWCNEHFGPSRRDNRHRWTGGRWFLNSTYSFQFYNRRDIFWFRLAWAR